METVRTSTPHSKSDQTIPSFCFLGFFLMISLSTSLSLSGFGAGDSLNTQTQIPFGPFTKLVLFTAVACFSARLHPLYAKSRLIMLATVTLSFGAAITLVSRSTGGGLGLFTSTAGPIITSIGTVPLYLAWMELYAKMDMRHVLLYCTGTHLLSSFLSFAFTLINSAIFSSAAIVALPILSAALLLISARRIDTVPFAHGEVVRSGWSFPFKPVALFAGFTFCNNFLRGFLSGMGRGYALFGVILVSLVLLACIVNRFKKFNIRSLYLISLPMAVAGALCTLIDLPNAALVGSLLTNGAYTLFSIFITAVLCTISFRYGVNPLWTFGFSQSALAFVQIIAQVIHNNFDVHLQDAGTFTLCICLIAVAIVVLFVVFLSDKDFTSTWGMTLSNRQEQDANRQPSIVEQAGYLARIQGLTRREEEILALLLEEKSVADIEQTLFISNSTAKTHIRHIYKKLDVHSKQELIQTCLKS